MNRINLICLGVRNMEKSLSFYKGIGFKTYEKENCPPIVFFDNQGSKLELYPLEALMADIDPDSPLEAKQGAFPGFTLACNLKSEDEVDKMMEKAKACGANVVKEPQKVFWGGYSGYFKDPDGYYWELAYGEIWKFDSQDMLVIE